MKPNIVLLTCYNKEEANLITKNLLKKHLVYCVKKTAVSSSYLWKGKIESAEEVLLIMDSIEENFTAVEKEVKKIHSYETPVLMALPVEKTTEDVVKWMKEELRK